MPECDDGNEFMGVLRMVVNLRLRGFSSVTQRMYLGCAQRFAAYQSPGADRAGRGRRAGVSRPPRGERHASRATLGVYVAALHFLYRATLDHPDVVPRIRYPRRVTERLPEILSPAEIERLLAAARSLTHRAMGWSLRGGSPCVGDKYVVPVDNQLYDR
jgi:integrase